MSQMPEQVLLHKDEKYNTLGSYSAYSDTYILYEKEQDRLYESSLEEAEANILKDYVGYIPEYRIKELLQNACRWLREKAVVEDNVVKEFRETMIKDSLAAVNWED